VPQALNYCLVVVPKGRIKVKRYLKNPNSGNKCGFLYKIYRKLLIFKSLSAKVRSNFPSILSQPGQQSTVKLAVTSSPPAQTMYKTFFSRTAILLLSLAFTACSAATSPQIQPSTPAGSPVNQPQTTNSESAQKVVALTPLTADIIHQLDPTKLVGIPGSALVSSNPKFTGITAVTAERTPPNLEKIIALKPDLVVGASGFHDQTMQKLQQLGIKTLLTQVDSWTSLEELTTTLAKSLNVNPEPLLKRYQTFLADIPNQSPATLVLVSRQPILSPNQSSWAGDLLGKFNVKNVAAQLQGDSPVRGYVTLSAEKILEANPEVIIIVDRGEGILDEFKSDSFWNQLTATKNNRVYVFDYYGLVNPGSIEKIEQATAQLKQVLAKK
jgi:iron complex transport system substrate-binding protein